MKHLLFAFRRKSSADDPGRILVAFSKDHHDDSTIDGPNGDEAVFVVGMDFVKDLQIVGTALCASSKERPCLA